MSCRFERRDRSRDDGELDDAEAVLEEVRAAADRLGFRPALWRIGMAMTEVATAKDQGDRAAQLRTAAASIIDRIADSIDDPALRSSFLKLPEVRSATSPG
jgi:hypothetical protein